MQIDTNGGDAALSRVATVNGAVMLDQAINAAPALASAERAAAASLAKAYTEASARASSLHRDDPEWQAVVENVNTKDAQMKAICSGG
ncbi:hypothetical protein [Mycobacterium marinum]|uniref:hypothetical protein n=1 Tax=Mycobacterium marinum TaxID=1781 RepID=UPI0035624E51